MKNNIRYLLSFFSLISLLLSGCSTKKSEPVITIDALINGKAIDHVALALNSLMSYEFDIQSSEKIGRIELTRTVNGVSNNIAVTGAPGSTGEKVVGSVEVTSEMQLTLIVYGNNWKATSKTILIQIFATTNAITEITLTSAKTGGVIADAGTAVTSRGVCYSKQPNPSIDLVTKTSDGTGTGSFVSQLSNLSMGTTYYVRSYAAGAQGVLYGNELSFTTLSPPVPAIPNGGFEAPVISGFVMNPQPNVWTFTGGGAGMQRNGSAFAATAAPEGTQTGLFQQGAEISQSMDFPAGNYAIGFMAAQRGTQAQTFEIYIDDLLIGKVTPASSAWESFVSNTFTVTAGSHKITIRGTNPKGGDNSGFVDDVKLLYRP